MVEPVEVENYSTVDYGLIAPDGTLFSCSYTGHCGLAEKMAAKGVLDENSHRDHHGAVHIAGGRFDYLDEWAKGRSSYMDEGYEKVTRRQLDTMLDYMVAHDFQFDLSALTVI